MKAPAGIILFITLIITGLINSQPLIDVFKFYYLHSPEKGMNDKTSPLKYDYLNFNINVPIELKKDGDAFIINPFYENNQGTVSGNNFHVTGQGIATGFLKKNQQKTKTFFATFILRRNFELNQNLSDVWQYGGAVLYSWKTQNGIWFKAGIYYNKEFFGNYFMALAGIDWKINAKNNLYGVLPGNFVYEHKVNSHFYYGGVFRALTNSYREPYIDPCFSGDCSAKKYLRIDDNQLGIFADYYISKHIAFTAETGYTILRRWRYGLKGDDLHTYTNYRNDNFYFKAGIEYRLRFR